MTICTKCRKPRPDVNIPGHSNMNMCQCASMSRSRWMRTTDHTAPASVLVEQKLDRIIELLEKLAARNTNKNSEG